ncbi:MAG: response regulator transcription factor [Anaerolineales bacterium]|nr:response regulator transcription factor [Anaerolineales bacterium]
MRLLLVDDHEVVRSGLQMLLQNEADVEIVGEVATAEEALDLVVDTKPDVVVMDIGLPGMSGIDAARAILEREPSAAIVALTIHEDEEYFFKMLDAGASGYVPKRAAPDEFLKAIRAAASGEVYLYPSLAKLLVHEYLDESGDKDQQQLSDLTPREVEVLELVAEGMTNREMGQELTISPKTVARHRENIMRKLNLHSRTELVRYAIRKGVIEP